MVEHESHMTLQPMSTLLGDEISLWAAMHTSSYSLPPSSTGIYSFLARTEVQLQIEAMNSASACQSLTLDPAISYNFHQSQQISLILDSHLTLKDQSFQYLLHVPFYLSNSDFFILDLGLDGILVLAGVSSNPLPNWNSQHALKLKPHCL